MLWSQSDLVKATAGALSVTGEMMASQGFNR